MVVLYQKRPPLLEYERFTHFITFPPTINNFMKKAEEVGQINPKPAIDATSVNPAIDEGIVAFYQHKPFALEALHTFPVLSDYRRRFMINATHPASKPPPMRVVPKYTKTFVLPEGWVPSHKSRTPPWTIRTERVNRAPIMNHHVKDRSAMVMPENRAQPCLSATLANALQAVKNRQRSLASYSLASDLVMGLSPR